MLPLLDSSPEKLESWLIEHDQPIFRARQIRSRLFGGGARSFDEMSDLPKPLRRELEADWTLFSSRIAAHTQSADGTEKLLLAFPDGHQVESVLIREGSRRTVCISTQVGCAMGCVFCASGLEGVARNLTTGEIVEQMLRLSHLLADDERLSHVVVMGMGEPLANLGALLPALDEATSPSGFSISSRRITISTVGLPAGIRRLAEEGNAYRLAVSLHAPDDALRNRLVPVNRNVGLGPIIEAVDDYFRVSGRRVTFEYILLGGINDQAHHARRLADIVKGRPSLVNVIPYNRVEGLPYETPSAEAVRRFVKALRGRGVAVQQRKRKGDRIDAACGQLRRSFEAAAT